MNLRIAVVGCGYWGSKHVRIVNEMPSVRLALAVDPAEDRLAHIRAQYRRVPVTRDIEAALRPNVDAIVLATPVSTHYELAARALSAGKHVLVEKPLAASSAKCRELIALADRRGLVLMVGHTFEYHPAVAYLRNLASSGELGELYYIDTARLNLGLFRRDVDVLWDLAPHDISMIYHILGGPALAVSARGNSYALPEVNDVAFADLTFPGRATAHLHVSWLAPCKVRRVTIVGSKAMVVFNDVSPDEKIRIYDKRYTAEPEGDNYADHLAGYHHGNITIPALDTAEPLRLEIEDFVRAIVTGSKVRADGASGLRVVETLEAASCSMANYGAMVTVPRMGGESLFAHARGEVA